LMETLDVFASRCHWRREPGYCSSAIGLAFELSTLSMRSRRGGPRNSTNSSSALTMRAEGKLVSISMRSASRSQELSYVKTLLPDGPVCQGVTVLSKLFP
jgi:hypothetical protein